MQFFFLVKHAKKNLAYCVFSPHSDSNGNSCNKNESLDIVMLITSSYITIKMFSIYMIFFFMFGINTNT